MFLFRPSKSDQILLPTIFSPYENQTWFLIDKYGCTKCSGRLFDIVILIHNSLQSTLGLLSKHLD